MSAVVLFESEFGATRHIAAAIAAGMRELTATALEDVRDVIHPLVTSVDLLVVGAPTHARSLPSPATRAEAQKWPTKEKSTLMLELHADQPGVREWLDEQNLDGVNAVAFSTRMNVSRLLSGSSVRSIERGLRAAGATIGSRAETFVVDTAGNLVEGELERAAIWGRDLAATVARALTGSV